MENPSESDIRLNNLLDMIGNIAALDFSKVLVTSEKNDKIDAIALGLNMLAEELNTQVVDRTKLDEVNNKLEKFAYTTAHDLKSPLNNTTALLDVLKIYVETGDKAAAQEIISKLEHTNKKMRRLVEGILDYSRTYSIDLCTEEVNLSDIIDEIIEVDNVKEHADVTLPQKLPTVWFHKAASIQVFRNLVDNAIKYSDKERCRIEIKADELSDSYQITVLDNGPGIAPEANEKVFELYTRMHPEDESHSVGIGLATVKNVIESAGGKIWLESKPGEGAAFIFTLKKAESDLQRK